MTVVLRRSLLRRAERAVAPGVAALLVLPFARWQNSWFEWANALWLLETQTEWVRTHGVPSPFLHAPDQIFYLFPLFYAGALFGLLSYPSLLFGAWPVFVAVTAGSMVLMQQGVAWLARSLRVDRTLSAVLGLGFVSTPYVIALLYGRGAWTELVASAGVLIAIGGGADVCARGAARRRAVVAMVGGVALVAATHNLALLFGVPIGTVALLAALWGTGTVVSRRSLATVATSYGAGACLAGATLVPNLWLARETWISLPAQTAHVLAKLQDFHDLAIVLRPWPVLPASEPSGSAVYVQTAVPLLIWAAVSAGVHRGKVLRYVAPLAALAAMLVVAIVNPMWWRHLPTPLQSVQFPFRLVTWLSLAVVLACAVTISRTAPAKWGGMTLVVVVFSQTVAAAAIAIGADGRAPVDHLPLRRADVAATSVPSSFRGVQGLQFRLPGRTPRPTIERLAPERLRNPPTTFALAGIEPAGTRLATNVAVSPFIVVSGEARVVGRDKDGFAVLEVLDHTGPRWEATVRPRVPAAAWAGIALTGASGLVVAAWALTGLRRGTGRLAAPTPSPSRIDT